MNPAIRRAGLLLFAALAIAVVVWNLVPQTAAVTQPGPQAPPSYGEALPSLSPMAVPGPAAAENLGGGAFRDYAIALPELRGLPPDAPPGTALELWVTWDRPVTRAPKVQRLLPRAFLVRVIPPITPDGVAAAILRVPTDRMSDLLYADGYGALSATVLT